MMIRKALALAVLCGGHGLACAQDSAPDHDTSASSTVLEAIVIRQADKGYQATESVSATRTATPLQQLPQSVSVISERLIHDQQPVTIADALRNVSNLVVNNSLMTPVFESTRIRGFPAEQSVDGFTQFYNPGDRDSLVNVARIEVLKGPNGVLYSGGAGAPAGGLVNIVSKQPERGNFLTLGAGAGSYDYYRTYVDANAELSDNVRVRLTGEYTQSRAFVDVLRRKQWNLNPSLLWTDNQDASVLLQWRSSRWRGQGYQGLPVTGTLVGDIQLPRSLFIGPDNIESSYSEFDAAIITARKRFRNGIDGTIKLRHARSEFKESVRTIVGRGNDLGASLPLDGPPEKTQAMGLGLLPFALLDGQMMQRQKENSMVAHASKQMSLGTASVTWLAGADYSRYRDSGYIDAVTPGPGVIAIEDLANPVFAQPYAPPVKSGATHFVTNTTGGMFLQSQVQAGRFHVLGALRYGLVKVDYTRPGLQSHTKVVGWLPRLGLVYDLTEQVSLFAGYSKGYRGQPFEDFLEGPEPQVSRQIEGGIKFLAGSRLFGQVALFQIRRANVAVPMANPPKDYEFAVVPQGRQRARGIELEVQWQPAPRTRVLAAYSHIKARYESNNFSYAVAGDVMPGIPTNAFRLWLQRDRLFVDRLSGGIGLYAQSGTRVSIRQPFMTSGYAVLDASLRYDVGAMSVALTVKNLLNRRYFERLNYLGGRVAPGRGREAYVTLEYRL